MGIYYGDTLSFIRRMIVTHRRLPEKFATPRFLVEGYYDFQMLSTRTRTDGATSIQNVPWLVNSQDSVVFERDTDDTTVYSTTIIGESNLRRATAYYWYLPYRFKRNGEHIRVIDFQMHVYLPANFQPVNIGIDQERGREMRNLFTRRANENTYLINDFASPILYTPNIQRRPRTGTPPPVQNPGGSPPSPLYDLLDDLTALPTLTDFPSVSRSIVQVQTLPLPKSVGDTLIDAAIHRGEDCPILYNKLGDCQSVSITSCFHLFDTDALQEWRTTSSVCPCCRTPITSVVSKRLRNEN
jgi:hypothetical protein